MSNFIRILNSVETAYSYMAARGADRYSVDIEGFTLTVSREAISLEAIGEDVMLLNRGYYQLSTIISLMSIAIYGN